jgi:peroxiredoxin
MSGLVAVGDTAPEFTAEASDGRVCSLHELLAGGQVLLAFYPGNDTPG